VDEHRTPQHQERNRRYLSIIRPAAHRALSRELRVAVQSPFRSRQNVERLSRVAAQTGLASYQSIAAIRSWAEISG